MNVTLSGDVEEYRARLNELIEEGLAELDRGEGIPGKQAFEALWERIRRLKLP